jgi:hypothetical protein
MHITVYVISWNARAIAITSKHFIVPANLASESVPGTARYSENTAGRSLGGMGQDKSQEGRIIIVKEYLEPKPGSKLAMFNWV